MRQVMGQPYLLLRGLEWVFGLLLVVLVLCAFAFGWFGAALDTVAEWYAGLFTASFEVRDVKLPPESALAGYVPGFGIDGP